MTELSAGKAFLDIVPVVNKSAAAAGEAQVGGMLAGLAGKAKVAALGIGAGIAAVGIGAGVALFEVGKNLESAYNTIRVGTGKTGDALKGLEGDFRNVLKVRPDSLDAVASTVTKLNVGLGLTGPQLDAVAVAELQLSRITKTDLNGNLEASAALFNNWGIKAEDQVPKLDEVFRAAQATGVSVTDLMDSMSSSGSVLRTVGLDFEQSAALLGLLDKVGVSASSVLVPLSRSIATAVKEGRSAKDVLTDVFSAIKNAPNSTAAAGAAIQVFGVKTGPKLAGLIREGKLSYEDLAKTIGSGGDTIAQAAADTSTLSSKFGIFKNRIVATVAPLATDFVNGLNKVAGEWLPKVADLLDSIVPKLETFGQFLKDVGTAAVQGFQGGGPTEGVLGFFAELGRLAAQVRDTVVRVWDDIVGGFQNPDAGNALGGLDGYMIGLGATLAKLQPIVDSFFGFIEQHAKPILIGLGIALALLIAPFATIVAGVVYAYFHFQVFRNIVDSVFSFIITQILPRVLIFVTYLREQIGHLIAWVQTEWPKIQEAIGHVLVAVEAVVGVFVAAVLWVWTNFHDTILTAASSAWSQLQQLIKTALDIVRGIFSFFVDLINGDWGAAWNDLLGVLRSVWDLIFETVRGALTILWNLMQDGLQVTKNVLGAALGWIVDQFTALPGELLNAAGDVFGFLEDSMRNAINAVITLWNGIKFTTPNIPGTDFGSQDITVPQIPLIPGGSSSKKKPPSGPGSRNGGRLEFLAAGGDIAGAGPVVVGDRGAEILDLAPPARVTPLERWTDEHASKGGDSFVFNVYSTNPESAAKATMTRFREHKMSER